LKIAYLGLGSNMGDKVENLKMAVDMINGSPGVEVVKVSSVYDTSPVGYVDQDSFANICVEVRTELEPYDLLAMCNHVEDEMGRVRLVRWGPRTLDVDILLYENYRSEDEKLTVPHPRMWERAFVLVPLNEIADHMECDDFTMLQRSLETIGKDDLETVRKISTL
jgi:2-amino-4-hydroxy-6-hydroxymethyldihydropteridine diphosphokinase